MTIASQGTVGIWGDDTEFVRNGTIPDHINAFGSLNARWGIFDLKAPDEVYHGSHFRFTSLSPTIPPRSKIISATVSGAAQDGDGSGSSPQGGTLTALIEVIAKDGIWDSEPKTSAHWVSAAHSTYSWTGQAEMRDTGAALLTAAASTIFGSTTGFRVWGNTTPASVQRAEKIGQATLTTAAGTIGSAAFRMVRTGSVTANVWVEVWSMSGGLPSSLLATSDSRSFNSISTSTTTPHTLESFTFSGANQIAISNATSYGVVLAGDSPKSFTNYLATDRRTPGTSTDFGLMYGEGRGVCFGNYPSGQQVLDLGIVGSSVTWNCPQFILNTVYTTPSLVAPIQAYVNSPGYAEGDPFLVRIRPQGFSQLKNRGFKTWESPDTPGTVQYATLNIGWRPRIARVS